MSQIYMLTAPRDKVHKRAIKEFIKNHDIHRWIIAKETGRGGYEHWQIRLDTCASFEELKSAFPTAHIEKSTVWCNYERKEGNFIQSDDTTDIRRCRFGKLRPNQQRIIQQLQRQSDRGITVVYDPCGGSGKSFLIRHLFETGRGCYVPPTISSVQGIIQYVASGYRGEPYILIDIPRSTKWNTQVLEGLEAIKDGLVYDTRYHAQMRDIWGVKVLVTTNTMPNLDALSIDRWQILDNQGNRLSLQTARNAAKKTVSTKPFEH